MEAANAANQLHFVYCNTAGEVSQRTVSPWSEAGHYIKGYDVDKGRVLTFRKDRIQTYLDGSETLVKVATAAPPPRLRRDAPPDERPQILFTGFASVQRAMLEQHADAKGVRVVQTVTKGLTFLCAGPNAGPSKVDKARAQSVYIVSEPQLRELLETGVLPDDVVEGLDC